MSAPENAPPVELVDAAVNAWFAETTRAALIPDPHEHFRERMRAALVAAGWTATAAAAARHAARQRGRRTVHPQRRHRLQVLRRKPLGLLHQHGQRHHINPPGILRKGLHPRRNRGNEG